MYIYHARCHNPRPCRIATSKGYFSHVRVAREWNAYVRSQPSYNVEHACICQHTSAYVSGWR